MPHCTIESLKTVPYNKLEPEKLTILKGECYVGRFVALTPETYQKDGETKRFMRLVIENFDNSLKALPLFGFHDKFISGVKLVSKGDIIAVACTAMKDGKFPSYAVSVLTREAAEKLSYKPAPVMADSADDVVPF